ncbi:hypothetical protein M404DRAFT_615637 [Pisolithus tinctorius Marx 270]|uniref:Uncharacterized protein n=1 Tax=Pisolithus tinctorius Marx 270 TaxID=870435 RepID=A0A0C3P8A0_PISTI|nr:hypothetical protein M404DRAFT_615637 [Pisolithus tinctorius Marx 270]
MERRSDWLHGRQNALSINTIYSCRTVSLSSGMSHPGSIHSKFWTVMTVAFLTHILVSI